MKLQVNLSDAALQELEMLKTASETDTSGKVISEALRFCK